MIKVCILLVTFLLFGTSCNSEEKQEKKTNPENEMKFEIRKTEQEWKKFLDDESYRVLRQKGTERPHTGKYNFCLLYTSPSPRDAHESRMPSSA